MSLTLYLTQKQKKNQLMKCIVVLLRKFNEIVSMIKIHFNYPGYNVSKENRLNGKFINRKSHHFLYMCIYVIVIKFYKIFVQFFLQVLTVSIELNLKKLFTFDYIWHSINKIKSKKHTKWKISNLFKKNVEWHGIQNFSTQNSIVHVSCYLWNILPEWKHILTSLKRKYWFCSENILFSSIFHQCQNCIFSNSFPVLR